MSLLNTPLLSPDEIRQLITSQVNLVGDYDWNKIASMVTDRRELPKRKQRELSELEAALETTFFEPEEVTSKRAMLRKPVYAYLEDKDIKDAWI